LLISYSMRAWKYLLGALLLSAISIWSALLSPKDNNLHLIACDVGQGDAILAIYGKFQILTDGGPDNSVLTCLEKYIPFWDREIELVILTHTQLDHYGGLIEVFSRYKVGTFLTNDFDAGTYGLEALKNAMGGAMTRVVKPAVGTRLRLGMIYLDILHSADGLNSTKINDYSIVTRLTFADFEALLTGDIGASVTEEIISRGRMEDVDYIKIPHHGSKNGLTPALLEESRPEIAVISVGKNNFYGHPHEETLEMLKNRGIKILRTDEVGDVEIVTDGKTYWQKSN